MVTLDSDEMANAKRMNQEAMIARIMTAAGLSQTNRDIYSRVQARVEKCAVCPYLWNYELYCSKLPHTIVTNGIVNLFLTTYLENAKAKCPKNYWH